MSSVSRLNIDIAEKSRNIVNSDAHEGFWNEILLAGKQKHKCNACERSLSATEYKSFEKLVRCQSLVSRSAASLGDLGDMWIWLIPPGQVEDRVPEIRRWEERDGGGVEPVEGGGGEV